MTRPKPKITINRIKNKFLVKNLSMKSLWNEMIVTGKKSVMQINKNSKSPIKYKLIKAEPIPNKDIILKGIRLLKRMKGDLLCKIGDDILLMR